MGSHDAMRRADLGENDAGKSMTSRAEKQTMMAEEEEFHISTQEMEDLEAQYDGVLLHGQAMNLMGKLTTMQENIHIQACEVAEFLRTQDVGEAKTTIWKVLQNTIMGDTETSREGWELGFERTLAQKFIQGQLAIVTNCAQKLKSVRLRRKR